MDAGSPLFSTITHCVFLTVFWLLVLQALAALQENARLHRELREKIQSAEEKTEESDEADESDESDEEAEVVSCQLFCYFDTVKLLAKHSVNVIFVWNEISSYDI